MQFEFDRATAVQVTASGEFDAEVHPGWDINGNANGGYLLAIAGRAMRDASGRPDPISVSAYFVAPGLGGPVTVSTSTVKTGRQLVTIAGSMRGADRELLRVLGSFGDVAAMSGGFEHTTLQPPDLAPREQCVMHTADGGRVHAALADRLNTWFRAEHAPFHPGPRPGVALIDGWMAFADGRPFDTLSLLLAADGFPPPVFNLEIPPGWVPTIELTVHVRGIPAPGPVMCRFHSEVVQNGFLQEDGEVWDSTGVLVAQSRQLALLPRG